MATNAANLQNQSFAGQGYGLSGNLNSQALQGWNNIYGTQMQGYGIQNQANSSNMAGMGSLFGMLGSAAIGKWGGADGGQITGPGTGTSDSVQAVNTSNGEPIRVSNGEYVVPYSVVKAKGTEFFDKLVDKYHVPVTAAGRMRKAAIQR
jgi:hypothetical protein